MDVPSLPTDNLYKFITVLGLALTILFGYMAYEKDREDDRRLSDALVQQIDVHQEFARAINRAGAEAPKLLHELDYRGKQSDMTMDLLKSLLAKRTNKFPTVGWFIGLAVMGFMILQAGAILWYLKFQRHMDRLIAKGKVPNT